MPDLFLLISYYEIIDLNDKYAVARRNFYTLVNINNVIFYLYLIRRVMSRPRFILPFCLGTRHTCTCERGSNQGKPGVPYARHSTLQGRKS